MMRLAVAVLVMFCWTSAVVLADDPPHCCAPSSFYFSIETFTNMARTTS
jgi:hypothetical protein